jgi:ribosomal protein S15
VALLTERIRDLSTHFQTHKKDEHSRRGLAGLLNQRRALLKYLRASNFPRFCFAIHKLGLKDTFGKQVRVGWRRGPTVGERGQSWWQAPCWSQYCCGMHPAVSIVGVQAVSSTSLLGFCITCCAFMHR